MGKQPGTSVMGQGGAQGHWQGFLLLSCSTLLPQTAPKGPGTSTFFLLSLPGAVGTAWGGARAQGWADSGPRPTSATPGRNFGKDLTSWG